MTSVCPLATVLYHFDDASRFPVFETQTTAKGPVALLVDRDNGGEFLSISYQRQAADLNEVSIVLALPIVVVDGQPKKLLLDVLGDAGRCHFYLDAVDGSGRMLCLSLGVVDAPGWKTLRADASKLAPPLQFLRLRVDAVAEARLSVGLRSLSVTGSIRLMPPGIARRT